MHRNILAIDATERGVVFASGKLDFTRATISEWLSAASAKSSATSVPTVCFRCVSVPSVDVALALSVALSLCVFGSVIVRIRISHIVRPAWSSCENGVDLRLGDAIDDLDGEMRACMEDVAAVELIELCNA